MLKGLRLFDSVMTNIISRTCGNPGVSCLVTGRPPWIRSTVCSKVPLLFDPALLSKNVLTVLRLVFRRRKSHISQWRRAFPNCAGASRGPRDSAWCGRTTVINAEPAATDVAGELSGRILRRRPKCLYLATRALDPTGKGRARWASRWKPALNAFAITFDGRIN